MWTDGRRNVKIELEFCEAEFAKNKREKFVAFTLLPDTSLNQLFCQVVVNKLTVFDLGALEANFLCVSPHGIEQRQNHVPFPVPVIQMLNITHLPVIQMLNITHVNEA